MSKNITNKTIIAKLKIELLRKDKLLFDIFNLIKSKKYSDTEKLDTIFEAIAEDWSKDMDEVSPKKLTGFRG